MSKERSSGRTTRLVDEYIQRFFNNPMYTPIVVLDHEIDGKPAPRKNNIELLKKIEARLIHEHSSSKWYSTTDANMRPDWVPKKQKIRTPIYNPYNANDYLNDIGLTDEDKECVIIRTNDPITETRKNQLEYYKSMLFDLKSMGARYSPSLLDTMLVGRAEGHSTRLADKYVQEYFNLKPGEFIDIVDHYGGENNGMANKRLCDVICGRLKAEHGEKFYIHRGIIPRIVRVESKK